MFSEVLEVSKKEREESRRQRKIERERDSNEKKGRDREPGTDIYSMDSKEPGADI